MKINLLPLRTTCISVQILSIAKSKKLIMKYPYDDHHITH